MDNLDSNQYDDCDTSALTSYADESNPSVEYTDIQSSILQEEYAACLNNFFRSLPENSNHNGRLDSQSYECGYESGVQCQQPSEATDDSNPPVHMRAAPVETTFDKSLNFSNYPDDMHSLIQENQVTDENLAAVISEIDRVCIEAPTPPSPVMYRRSLCVPCNNDQEEEAVKQTLTTIITDYPETKKDKKDLRHIMISYNSSTQELCLKISQALKDLGYTVWIDQDNISGNIFTSMASAVENAFVVLIAVNEKYYQSRYCRFEAEYSVEQNKAYIPMLMEAGYKARGWLGIINGAKLHIDFCKLPFDPAFNLLLREIEAVRISLGAEKHEPTSMICQSPTTMQHSWTHFRNVREWNADDVVEWLYREKLDLFQAVFTNFTGATLWQLYKIKADSASDYYRSIESLLPSDVPLRLFYNLTLNAALESLFSSSTQCKHG